MSAAPYFIVTADPNWIPQPGTIAIGNAQCVLYDRSPGGSQVDQISQRTFGALQFTFRLHVATASASLQLDPATVDADTSLYLGMLGGFQYTPS
jgi:hypothetical protein